jgi:transglutaminase-like putative cysteine protease
MPEELVFNGGIELISGSYGPTGWDSRGLGQENATCDAQKAATGVRSLRLTGLDDRPVPVWRQEVPAPPAGTRLRLRVAACAELEPGAQVVVGCSGVAGPKPRLEIARGDIGPEWTTIETEVTVSEHTAGVTIRAALKGTGTAWFDDFSLAPIIDGLEPPADLEVVLPLLPACGRQAPVAVHLSVEPEPPTYRVRVQHDPENQEALRVRLEKARGDFEFSWSTLCLLGSIGPGKEVLDEAIPPAGKSPAALGAFLHPTSAIAPEVPEAQGQLAALHRAVTYADVFSLCREVMAGVEARRGQPFDRELTWRDERNVPLPGAGVAAAMFRARGVPARVVRVLPFSRWPDRTPTTSWLTTEIHLPTAGWVPLPATTQAEGWTPVAVLDVLPAGERRPPDIPSHWRPARLIRGGPAPADPPDARATSGWAAFSINSLPLTQDELTRLRVPCWQRWQDSLGELVEGRPSLIHTRAAERLRSVKSADELAAALVE